MIKKLFSATWRNRTVSPATNDDAVPASLVDGHQVT